MGKQSLKAEKKAENTEKYFSIKVYGKGPQEVMVGTINKNTGFPDPGARRMTLTVGECPVPNYSNVWGILHKDAKGLTGQITFLPWGTKQEGAGLVEIRYLRSCPSLSIQYQKEKGYRVTDADAEIPLKRGINAWEWATNELLITMLQHHTLNKSNGSRDPEIKNVRFETHKTVVNVNNTAAALADRHRAEQIIIDLWNDDHEAMEKLAQILGVHYNDDQELFDNLIMKAQRPAEFLNKLKAAADTYKKDILQAMELDLLRFGADNSVHIQIGGAPDMLIYEVKGDTNDEKIEWITDNFLKTDINAALKRLAGVLSTHKETVLE